MRKYSEIKDDLDNVMNNLHSDELDLDQAIKLYERGIKLTNELGDYIRHAENKIKTIKAKKPEK